MDSKQHQRDEHQCDRGARPTDACQANYITHSGVTESAETGRTSSLRRTGRVIPASALYCTGAAKLFVRSLCVVSSEGDIAAAMSGHTGTRLALKRIMRYILSELCDHLHCVPV